MIYRNEDNSEITIFKKKPAARQPGPLVGLLTRGERGRLAEQRGDTAAQQEPEPARYFFHTKTNTFELKYYFPTRTEKS